MTESGPAHFAVVLQRWRQGQARIADPDSRHAIFTGCHDAGSVGAEFRPGQRRRVHEGLATGRAIVGAPDARLAIHAGADDALAVGAEGGVLHAADVLDWKSTRLNSSHIPL